MAAAIAARSASLGMRDPPHPSVRSARSISAPHDVLDVSRSWSKHPRPVRASLPHIEAAAERVPAARARN